MGAYTLDEVHDEIQSIYLWWAITAGPEIAVQEAGHLGDLWALHDRMVEEQRANLTPEEFEAEYGRGNR